MASVDSVATASRPSADAADRSARAREGARRPRRAGRGGGWPGAGCSPLLWIGPAIVLIALVVLLPVVLMFRTAFRNIDTIGFDHGWAGWANFDKLFGEQRLGSIIERTRRVGGVVVVVTVVISLLLAQLFNQAFPGRRITRWALIAPWAASVFMTGVVFRWMLNRDSGLDQRLPARRRPARQARRRAGRLARPARPPRSGGWSASPCSCRSRSRPTRCSPACRASRPTCTRRPGSTARPRWRTYFSITLPLLRPALLVAVLINIMNVFNNFPIIWSMTRGGPGDQTATTTIFMYQIKASSIPESAAMSVLNFGLVIVLVLLFLRVSRRGGEAA